MQVTNSNCNINNNNHSSSSSSSSSSCATRSRRQRRGLGKSNTYKKRPRRIRPILSQPKVLKKDSCDNIDVVLLISNNDDDDDLNNKKNNSYTQAEWDLIKASSYDPLNPMVVLQAVKEGWFAQKENANTAFRPSVQVVDEVRTVPVSYSKTIKQIEDEEATPLSNEHNDNNKNKNKSGDCMDQDKVQLEQCIKENTKLEFLTQRLRFEERVQENLQSKVRRDSVEFRLKLLDNKNNGFISADIFKNAVKLSKNIKLSSSELDNITNRITDGNNMINYREFFGHQDVNNNNNNNNNNNKKIHMGITNDKSTHCKSAADLFQESRNKFFELGTSEVERISQKNSKTTSELFRPGTGKEGFFPEQERFITTKMMAPGTSLANLQTREKARLLKAKREILANHTKRIDEMKYKRMEKEEQLDRAHVESITRLRTKYLEPLELQKERDQYLSSRPRGKRYFNNLPSHLDNKKHQLVQRIGEEECRKAYQIYETRTRTEDWRRVFDIKSSNILPHRTHIK